MSKWEDSFHKNKESYHCMCTNDNGLFVPNRQLSLVVASLLFLFFGCFITGYFLGKRSGVEQFTQKMTQDSFSDQIHTSLLTAQNENSDEHSEKECVVDTTISQEVLVSLDVQDSLQELTNETERPAHHYYAQLIGFGTEKAAQKFVQKLAAKNIETLVKKRPSKTAKGRTVYWYQVVTPAYNDKEALTALVDRLAKDERLSGVSIGTC